MSTFEQHPYLWGTLMVTLPVCLFALRSGRQGRFALFSGLALAPTGLYAFTFDAYWRPLRLNGQSMGVEDVLFGFCCGLVVWLLAALSPFTRRLRVGRASDFAPRLLMMAVAGAGIYLTLWSLGANPMTALVLGAATCAAISLVVRPDLTPLLVPAAITYPLFHGLTTALVFYIWPEFRSKWNADHFWGTPVALGLPLGEIAWAAVFGASWPPIVALLLDARTPRANSAETD